MLVATLALAMLGVRPRNRVLVETPSIPDILVTWNSEIIANPKSGVGISGTHTALLAMAERFAASGWETYLVGQVTKPSSMAAANGVHYVPLDEAQTRLKALTFNVTIVSTALSVARFFTEVVTQRLCILMEMQDVDLNDAKRLKTYSEAQRAVHPSYELVFAHLSPWGQSLFPRYAPTWMQLSQWVRHLQWRNPVDTEAVDRISSSSHIPRNPLGFVFPACYERGGAVAARVYARVRDRYGGMVNASRMHTSTERERERESIVARATWAQYAKDNRGSIAERDGIRSAAGQGLDVLVTHFSKEALLRELLGSSFFVYGLASVRGIVHYDTFANAVAEALVAGVLVLAPPIAALPSVFGEAVMWVTPPGGIPAKAQSAYKPLHVPQLYDDTMIDRYVDAIEHLRANSTRRAQMQRYAQRLVRRYSAERVTVNLYELLTSCTATGSIAARKTCEEHHQRYQTFPNLKL